MHNENNNNKNIYIYHNVFLDLSLLFILIIDEKHKSWCGNELRNITDLKRKVISDQTQSPAQILTCQ